MTVSLDDVLALLGKWKNEGSGIHLIFSSPHPPLPRITPSVMFSGFATVLEVSGLALRLAVGSHASFTVTFLDACCFEYADPREASEEVRAASEQAYECLLIVKPPSGEHIQLMEIKSR